MRTPCADLEIRRRGLLKGAEGAARKPSSVGFDLFTQNAGRGGC